MKCMLRTARTNSTAEMIVLDASCLVGLLLGEPGQPDIVAALTHECAMSVLNRAEVIDRITRKGAPGDDVAADLDTLGITYVALDADTADRAGKLRARHYHRTERPLSMADCVALATALAAQATLATSDAPLAATAHAEGCAVLPVANSAGIYPASAAS